MNEELEILCLSIEKYIKKHPTDAVHLTHAIQGGIAAAVDEYRGMATDLEVALIMLKTSPRKNQSFIYEKLKPHFGKSLCNLHKFFTTPRTEKETP